MGEAVCRPAKQPGPGPAAGVEIVPSAREGGSGQASAGVSWRSSFIPCPRRPALQGARGRCARNERMDP